MSGDQRTDIRSLTREEITSHFLQQGEKKFRAGQVYDWLWKHGCNSFGQMTNLPSNLRQHLSEFFAFQSASISTVQESSDGTVKTGFMLYDGLVVEAVLIPAGDRNTLCISSQVGCSMGCRFCATGQLGFTRNLTVGEIVDQFTGIRRLKDGKINELSNIVFMGMGEPLLNYENVKASIERITAPDGFGMSPQRITVSSVGIPKMIRKMADDDAKYHFALSLHAATDSKRDQIIPLNRKFPLADLIQSLKYYHTKTGRRITLEYILFRDFNDGLKDAADLAVFCKNFPVKINIIEYNSVTGTGFTASTPEATGKFKAFLEGKNLVVNVRKSRGKDIDAACGQLAGKSKTARKPVQGSNDQLKNKEHEK